MASKEKKEEMTETSTKKAYPLAKVESLLPEGRSSFNEVKENLAGLDDEVQFPRVRFLNDAKFHMTQDDDEGVGEFQGVILSYVRQNTYWASGFDPNNPGPPECFSLDGKKGSLPRNSGGAYGECRDCKYNQFASAKSGKGKACRNQIKLFVQLEGKAIPVAFSISPANLQAFTGSFLMDQVNQKNLAYWKIVTKFTAYKKPKEQFGRIKFEVVSEFRDEEVKKIQEVRDFWLPAISNDSRALGENGGNSEAPSENVANASTPAEAEEASQEQQAPKSQPKPAAKTVVAKKPDPVSDEDPPF